MNLDPSVRARIQFAQPDEELRDRMVDAIMSTWDGGVAAIVLTVKSVLWLAK
jgi:hypothetical protein